LLSAAGGCCVRTQRGRDRRGDFLVSFQDFSPCRFKKEPPECNNFYISILRVPGELSTHTTEQSRVRVDCYKSVTARLLHAGHIGV
jgi:hypothetical protein